LKKNPLYCFAKIQKNQMDCGRGAKAASQNMKVNDKNDLALLHIKNTQNTTLNEKRYIKQKPEKQTKKFV